MDIERFQRWEGCDKVEDSLASGDRCVVTMDTDRSVSAYFDKRTDYILKFTSPDPYGSVNAYDQHNQRQYIDCGTEPKGSGGICTARVPAGSTVFLTGSALRPLTRFLQWGGDCTQFNEFGSQVGFIMGRDYSCTVEYETDPHIDFNQPNQALIREIDHDANAPSRADFNTCNDDCELVKLHEEDFNAIMDLVVDQVDPRWWFDGWEGCDRVLKVPAWSPYPVCRIGKDGYGLYPVRANFNPIDQGPGQEPSIADR